MEINLDYRQEQIRLQNSEFHKNIDGLLMNTLRYLINRAVKKLTLLSTTFNRRLKPKKRKKILCFENDCRCPSEDIKECAKQLKLKWLWKNENRKQKSRTISTLLICWNNFEVGTCDESLPALNHSNYWCDRQRTQLRDKYRLGNDSHWVPSFLSCCS